MIRCISLFDYLFKFTLWHYFFKDGNRKWFCNPVFQLAADKRVDLFMVSVHSSGVM